MKLILQVGFILASLYGCAGSGGSLMTGGYSKASSEPINRREEIHYKQALIRCHKTGGSRIVKINGILRCF